MRLNEKNVASFAVCSSPVDKEGYLQKKGDLNRDFQRRWFVLKGNLLFYFLKKQDREPQGVIVLEACSVQVSIHGRYCFEISFDGAGTRVYILGADNNEEMESWMKAISHASYEYLKSIVDELQRRVNLLSSSSSPQAMASGMGQLNVGAVAAATTPTSKTIKTVGLPGDPSVTLDDLSHPAPPKQLPRYGSGSNSTKVRKGILVDVDEAPPIPAKKKSATLHSLSKSSDPEPGHSSYTEQLLKQQQQQLGEDQMDAEMLGEAPLYHSSSTATSKAHAPLRRGMKSLPPQGPMHPSPFSSPLVPHAPIEDPDRPLSPPSTLDRTPVLVPSPAHENEISVIRAEKEIGGFSETPPAYHQVNLPVPTATQPPKSEEVADATILPSRHPPQANRKLVAPLDPNKTFMEMHQDFAEAMKTLNTNKASADHTPS